MNQSEFGPCDSFLILPCLFNLAKRFVILSFFCLSLSRSERRFHSSLLFRNLDVFHKLLFGLVSRNFHNGDGRDTRQIHIRCSAAACRMGLYQVAFIDQMCFGAARRAKNNRPKNIVREKSPDLGIAPSRNIRYFCTV